VAPEKELESVLCGFHAVEKTLREGSRHLNTLYLSRSKANPRTRHLEGLAREKGIRVRHVDHAALDRMAPRGSHQGVVATVDVKPSLDLEDLLQRLDGRAAALIVVLDGVQDPHNLGAVVRNAALCGAPAVVVPRDGAAGTTATVEKVAAGALAHVDIVRVGNLAAALRKLKEAAFWVVGADAGGDEELPGADLSGRVALVIGNEERGLRRLTREHCDRIVSIPSTGTVSSFNLSVAAGIILFAAFLQQRNNE
jgi:23S rRNA (guanosine2251-2'-O)-methyltransferase